MFPLLSTMLHFFLKLPRYIIGNMICSVICNDFYNILGD